MALGSRKSHGVEEHSSIVLFSNPVCPESHRIRLVLSEKDIAFNLVNVPNQNKPPEDLLTLNPGGRLPTLADRTLVIDEPRIISEYLDERFPHPPLMPVEPIPRAKLRIVLLHIEKEWYPLIRRALNPRSKNAEKASMKLTDDVLAHADMFKMKRFFMSDEFSLVDCAIAPLLWRFPGLGITLPPNVAKAINRYRRQVFSRSGFIRSLSQEESRMPLS